MRNNRSRQLLMFLIIISSIDFFGLARLVDYGIYQYIRVALYVIMGLLIWYLPRHRAKVKLKYQSEFYLWAILIASLYLISVFLGGVVNGFGRSPYNLTPKGIFINLTTIIFPMMVTVWIRHLIIREANKRNKLPITIGTTVIVGLSYFSFNQLYGYETLQAYVVFYAKYVLPIFSLECLISYFIYMAGPKVGLLFLVMTTLPFYVLSVLPNLEWLTAITIKSLLPAFSLMVMHEHYTKKTRAVKKRGVKEESTLSIMVNSVVAVGFIWFVVGVFPIFPRVILTGSMLPVIEPGDIVLIERTDYREIDIEDVILYEINELSILHRVIEVDREKHEYITKGDNNPNPDKEAVSANQLEGRLVGKVPYIGRLIILFRGGSYESYEVE